MQISHNLSAPEARDPEAYQLGRRGIRISADSLLQHLRRFTDGYYEEQDRILSRKLQGVGVLTHHGFGILAGLGVFIAALVVDYFIVREFWTWALSNEMGELQQTLRDSVIFKSLQVVFATMAIHYMLSNIGKTGRSLYTVFIFLLTIMMIVGIGTMWATNTLPPGAKLFGVDIHGSADTVNTVLRDLGLPAPDSNAAGSGGLTSEALRSYQTLIWLSALSVLFLIVASVGALALETAIRSFTGLTGGALYDTNSVATRSQELKDELARIRVERDRLKADREGFYKQKIAEFVAAYTAGVLAANFGGNMSQELIDTANKAAIEVRSRFDEL